MTEPKFIIYGLVDPITDEVRYIGKSTLGLARPKRHFCPSSLNRKSHKNHWIKSLNKIDKMCCIRVLEVLSAPELLSAAEKKWIAFGRSSGWPLTNATDGGEGTQGFHGRLGYKHSKETKEKLRRIFTGRKHTKESRLYMKRIFGSPEARERNRQSQLGKKHTKATKKKMNISAQGMHLGSKNQCAKLTEKKIISIRKLYAEGITQKELAKQFKVSVPTISVVVNRITWNHV